jgi:hypothetical protein
MPKRKLPTNKTKETKENASTFAGGGDNILKISAATLKTKMLPGGLQNPITRKIIWRYIDLMFERRGYMMVNEKDETGKEITPPLDTEMLIADPKGVLGFYHKYAIKPTATKMRDGVDPRAIHVLFCSKAGGPTLKNCEYRSPYTILVSDAFTARPGISLKHGLRKEVNGEPHVIFGFPSHVFTHDILSQNLMETEVRFTPLTEVEIKKVEAEYKSPRTSFLRFFADDAIPQYLGLQECDVVALQRPFGPIIFRYILPRNIAQVSVEPVVNKEGGGKEKENPHIVPSPYSVIKL